MAESGKIVVLCRGLPEKNDMQKELESAGYTCECLQTLRFEFVNISELRTCLSKADEYSGLILTSPRTIEAIALAVNEDISILQHWEKLSAYCVGPMTESLAQSRLNLQRCIGSQSGNSKLLAEVIIRDIKEDSKPLLYPHSEIARETIASVLYDNGVLTHKLIVYKTLESESLGQDLVGMLKKSPSLFVFFSPSTVEYVAAQLKKNSFTVKDIRAVAIGPVTKDAMINFGFKVYAVADKPEPAALTHAIVAADSAKNSYEKDI